MCNLDKIQSRIQHVIDQLLHHHRPQNINEEG